MEREQKKGPTQKLMEDYYIFHFVVFLATRQKITNKKHLITE